MNGKKRKIRRKKKKRRDNRANGKTSCIKIKL